MIFMDLEIKEDLGGAWLAQTLEHATLDLRIMGSSPTLGIELTLNKSGGVLRKKNEIYSCNCCH